MKIDKLFGAIFALLSVIIGAFNSHALKKILPETALESIDIGLRYMMYHGLSMLILAKFEISKNVWIFRLFFWGTVLFSFSLFLLSLEKFFSIDSAFFGLVTPLGGTLLILAWTILIWRILKK